MIALRWHTLSDSQVSSSMAVRETALNEVRDRESICEGSQVHMRLATSCVHSHNNVRFEALLYHFSLV